MRTNEDEEMHRVIIGQENVLEKLILALVADGHVLLEGMPGLAKTLMMKTLSDTIDASFKRIQFTPDLLPADIIGTRIYNQNTCQFSTRKGDPRIWGSAARNMPNLMS